MWTPLYRGWFLQSDSVHRHHAALGWSLIEVIVVLAILGMVAATVSVSTRGVWTRFQATRALDTVLDLDHRARQLSVASGRGTELVLQGDHQIALRYLDGRVVKQATLSLPGGAELVCLSRVSTIRREVGFPIPYSPAGTSPAFLLGLASESRLTNSPGWMAVLAGGQRKRFESRDLAERWLWGRE